jgi:hypothetical protein
MPKRLTLSEEDKERLNGILTALDPIAATATATGESGSPRGKRESNTTGEAPSGSNSREKDDKVFQPSISDLKFFGGFGQKNDYL